MVKGKTYPLFKGVYYNLKFCKTYNDKYHYMRNMRVVKQKSFNVDRIT